MHLDPKALNAACHAFFDACRDGGARATADEPSLIRNLNVSLALKPAITAYLAASLPADAAELVGRLRGPLAISGEHRDEAASLIQSQAARIAELGAGIGEFAEPAAPEERQSSDSRPASERTCATCHAVLADGPQPFATYAPDTRPAEQAVTEVTWALKAAREIVDAVVGENRPARDWAIRVRDRIDAALAQEKGR